MVSMARVSHFQLRSQTASASWMSGLVTPSLDGTACPVNKSYLVLSNPGKQREPNVVALSSAGVSLTAG